MSMPATDLSISLFTRDRLLPYATQAANPGLFLNLPYDPQKDFVPVADVHGKAAAVQPARRIATRGVAPCSRSTVRKLPE